ncbi:MAG: hypothetical protein HY903_10920 [Deltaproteobacteria bacterium]|nr:hypothetical protein [Deltaproteobacteria bacterium]
MNRRVAVTGLGMVCSLGTGRAEVTTALRAGVRRFAPIRRFDASGFKVALAAEAPELDTAGRFGRRLAAHTSRTDALALWAAADAVAEATADPARLRDAGIFVGASSGGLLEMEPYHAAADRAPLVRFWTYPIWECSNRVATALGIGGPRATLMTACSSSAHALGLALRRVRSGELDLAIAGGSESICRLTLAGFGSLGVLDPVGTRPFDVRRQGITLGEGAAFFVLEPLEIATRRGARPLAILAGYGAAAEAHHMVHPREDGSGALAAMAAALKDAGLDAGALDYVNAHGTGTAQNDAMEARAINALVGPGRRLAVSSSKSMLGHTLGAAAALEAATVVLGMLGDFLPPNPGVTEVTPELAPLTLARDAGSVGPKVALSASFAFGGNDAALVLAAPSAASDTRPAAHERPRIYIAGGALTTGRTSAATLEALAGLVDPATPGPGPLDPAAVLGPGAVRRLDALSALATATTALAVKNAGLAPAPELGISFGTAFGALDATVAFIDRLATKGAHLVNPIDFPNLVHNAAAGHIGIHQGARGASLTMAQEELAGDAAFLAVCEQIRAGDLERAVAAGGDLQSTWLDIAYAKIDPLLRTTSRHTTTVGAVLVESAKASEGRGGPRWAEVIAVATTGPSAGVEAAVARVFADGARRNPQVRDADLWLTGATERVGEQRESRAAALPPLAHATRIPIRALLGDAAGSGPAAIAVGAAIIALGRAHSVLVTCVTRDGCAQATLLAVPT